MAQIQMIQQRAGDDGPEPARWEDPDVPDEMGWKREWDARAELRASFGDNRRDFMAFKRAEARGRVKFAQAAAGVARYTK